MKPYSNTRKDKFMTNWVTTIFFCLAPLTLSFWARAAEQSPGPHQVLVQTGVSREAEYPLKVKGILLIEAAPEVVWGVLTDYEHLEGVFPGLVRSRILRKEGEEVVVEQRYHGLLFLSKNMIFSSKETPTQRIDFQRLGGKSRVAGHWSLEPMAEGTVLLTLEVAVKPRRFFLWFMEGMLKKHVPYGLLSIRKKSLTKLDKDSPEDPKIIYQGEKGQDNPSQEDF